MPPLPRVEIAPGVYAESVVKHTASPDAGSPRRAHQVYRIHGGVFDHLELDSMSSLVSLVGILSTFDRDPLRSLAEEPAPQAEASPEAPANRAHRRAELRLPAHTPAVSAHRRFTCDGGAARRARIWSAETLGDCLPDTDWSVSLLEQTVLRAGELIAEAVASGATAALLTMEIDRRRLVLTRYDEFRNDAAG